MKTFKKIAALYLIITGLCFTNPQQSQAQTSVSFQVFYDRLSPYGQWIDYPGYGYAWVPSGGRGFVPYETGGYWAWTQYGWTWVSDYDWGWAPFHYGRWIYTDYYGWVWIPDNEWGPAWVSWRRCNGYYGWAPLAPGISINIAISNYNPGYDRWCFLNERYMGRHDIRNYYAPRKNNQTYINQSTVVNNTFVDNSKHVTYIAGPHREDVQRATGKNIQQVAVRDNPSPGQKANNKVINIYRPNVTTADKNIRPAKIANANEIKTDKNVPVPLKKAPVKQDDINKVQTPVLEKKQVITEPNKVTPKTERVQPQQKVIERQPANPQILNPNKEEPVRLPPKKVIEQPVQQPKQILEQKQPPVREERQQPVQQPRQIQEQRQPPVHEERQQPIQQPKQIIQQPLPQPNVRPVPQLPQVDKKGKKD